MIEISVMLSAGFREAYLELVREFEAGGGNHVRSLWVPSIEMMRRLKGGEAVDLVILPAPALDELYAGGIVGERVDLARSEIGLAVRAGAPKPDISSGAAVKEAVLRAKAIAYSTGPSGAYLAGLFQRMGIADRIRGKVTQVQGEPAGAVVARGDAEIAFQQVSELLPVPGIELVGRLPADIQQLTVFSAAVHARAREPGAAHALIRHFRHPGAAPVIRSKGMEAV